MKRQSYLSCFYLTTEKRDIASDINLEEENSDATAQEVKRHDIPNIYHHTSATDTVDINTSDVIYVGSSTVFSNASSELISLLQTTVNPTDAVC